MANCRIPTAMRAVPCPPSKPLPVTEKAQDRPASLRTVVANSLAATPVVLVGRSHERSSNENGQACPSRRGAGIRQEMLTRSGYEEEKCPNYPPTRRTPAQTCGVAADNVEAAQRDCGEHQSCSLRKDQEIPTATRLGMLGLDAELDQSCPALLRSDARCRN